MMQPPKAFIGLSLVEDRQEIFINIEHISAFARNGEGSVIQVMDQLYQVKERPLEIISRIRISKAAVESIDDSIPEDEVSKNSGGLMSTEQAARYLKGTKRWLEELRKTGKGPIFIFCGRRTIRYRQQDLDNWIESNTKSKASR